MTREDAIYEIRQLAVLSTNKNIERITEALNMAIEALQDEIWKDEPNNEPQYDAEEAAKDINRRVDMVKKEWNARHIEDEPQTDYERASEQREHDILYEPTYNPEDGSM